MSVSVGTAIKLARFVQKNWKKLLPALIGLLLLPLALFSASFTIISTVPAIDESTMRLYINTASEVGKDKSFINFKDMIAIDSVRYNQDFKKANKSNVTQLANLFLQENKNVTTYDLSQYPGAVADLNSNLGVSIDWREVAMIDALLTNESFNSSYYTIRDLARKFVRIDRIPYEVTIEEEVTIEKTKRIWKSSLPMLPDWLTQKWGFGKWIEETYYETEIVYRTEVRYREGKEVIGYEKVLQDLGYSTDKIPEFFKDKSTIKSYMEKTVITYSTRSIGQVMDMLGFTKDQKDRTNTYRNVGLEVLIGTGNGGNWNGSGENTPASASEFIERVSKGAQETQKKYGVLSSISIAQAILESGWGASGLTAKANNLFGVKADSSWVGAYVEMETREVYNGQEVIIVARFRAYESWAHSLADHGQFLVENSRYAEHGFFSANDYIGQAYALKEAGYATDPNYPMLLISIIQQYGLEKFDKI